MPPPPPARPLGESGRAPGGDLGDQDAAEPSTCRTSPSRPTNWRQARSRAALFIDAGCDSDGRGPTTPLLHRAHRDGRRRSTAATSSAWGGSGLGMSSTTTARALPRRRGAPLSSSPSPAVGERQEEKTGGYIGGVGQVAGRRECGPPFHLDHVGEPVDQRAAAPPAVVDPYRNRARHCITRKSGPFSVPNNAVLDACQRGRVRILEYLRPSDQRGWSQVHLGSRVESNGVSTPSTTTQSMAGSIQQCPGTQVGAAGDAVDHASWSWTSPACGSGSHTSSRVVPDRRASSTNTWVPAIPRQDEASIGQVHEHSPGAPGTGRSQGKRISLVGISRRQPQAAIDQLPSREEEHGDGGDGLEAVGGARADDRGDDASDPRAERGENQGRLFPGPPKGRRTTSMPPSPISAPKKPRRRLRPSTSISGTAVTAWTKPPVGTIRPSLRSRSRTDQIVLQGLQLRRRLGVTRPRRSEDRLHRPGAIGPRRRLRLHRAPVVRQRWCRTQRSAHPMWVVQCLPRSSGSPTRLTGAMRRTGADHDPTPTMTAVPRPARYGPEDGGRAP